MQAAHRAADLRLETLAQGLKVISLTHLGLLDEAALLATCVLENARQVSDPDTLLRSYVNLCVFYLSSGDASLAAKTLLEQLAPNGRLVIPVGSRFSQTLQVWIRLQDRFLHEDIIPVVFVPLLGKNGWTRDDASGMDG